MYSLKNISLYLFLITCTPVLWAQSSADCPTVTTISPSATQSVCEGDAISPLTAAITPAPLATSATDWLDLSANGYDAVLQNGVGYDAANGGVLTFDGVDDKVLGHTEYSVNTSQPFSVECWFKTDVLPTSTFNNQFNIKSNDGQHFGVGLVPSNYYGTYGTLTFGSAGSWRTIKM
uniref:hypothetical protein n=1 Tax=Lutibacter sp. TaxID=1925666 RepID=UPI003565C57D